MYSFEEIMEFHPDNRDVYNEIKRNLSVLIPFVGAGLTMFAYYSWPDALAKIAEKITNEDSHKKVKDLIDKKGDFLLDAAQRLEELRGSSNIARDIANLFSSHKMEEKQSQLPKESIWLLPLLFSELTITTNFDQVLETVYTKHNMPSKVFEPDHPELLNQYLNQAGDFPGIFKLHGSVCGDYIEYNRIIFTEKQYNHFYCKGSFLFEALKKCFSYKSVLFLGCSLSHDRTMKLLEQVVQPGQYHYTIINCGESERDNKIKELENKHIRAIVYEGNRHEAVRTILEQLLKESYPEKYQKVCQNSTSNKKYLLSDDDPVKKLVEEANKKSVDGDYIGALDIAKQALSTAEEASSNEEKDLFRIAYAKMQCAMKMHQIPEFYNTAIEYISDVISLGVFNEIPEYMFTLYFNLSDISILNNDLSTARSAIKKAYAFVKDDFETLRCESVEGKIAAYEGKYNDAVASFQKIVDSLNLKIATKSYKDNDECIVIKQNLAATFNDIAVSYGLCDDSQNALINIIRAVEIAEEAHLEFEHAVFLMHWAELLLNDGLYDSVIEKATEAKAFFQRKVK